MRTAVCLCEQQRQTGSLWYLVSVRHEPPDVNKQAMCGDAARHEVVIQAASDVQLFCGSLLVRTKIFIQRKQLQTIFKSFY